MDFPIQRKENTLDIRRNQSMYQKSIQRKPHKLHRILVSNKKEASFSRPFFWKRRVSRVQHWCRALQGAWALGNGAFEIALGSKALAVKSKVVFLLGFLIGFVFFWCIFKHLAFQEPFVLLDSFTVVCQKVRFFGQAKRRRSSVRKLWGLERMVFALCRHPK